MSVPISQFIPPPLPFITICMFSVSVTILFCKLIVLKSTFQKSEERVILIYQIKLKLGLNNSNYYYSFIYLFRLNLFRLSYQ